MEKEEKLDYWRQNIRLIRWLLLVWFLVSLGAGILFVTLLNGMSIGNLPFGFWMAQQGSIFVFVVLIYVYAKCMDKIDHDHHADE
jgi:putative solute:sodium symporter small subunit